MWVQVLVPQNNYNSKKNQKSKDFNYSLNVLKDRSLFFLYLDDLLVFSLPRYLVLFVFNIPHGVLKIGSLFSGFAYI